MHARHGREVVHEFSAHPYAFSIIATDGINETVFFWEQPRRHAREDGEDGEGEPVAECHCAADGGKD